MRVEYLCRTPTSRKYCIDGRYLVYLHDCSNQNLVIDQRTQRNITNTIEGLRRIVTAYNFKREMEENQNEGFK